MSETRTGYTFWSNDRSITEDGQCGVLHGRLFVSAEKAKQFYEASNHSCNGDVLVKVTVTLEKEPNRERR